MGDVIYLKELDNYDEIIKSKLRIPTTLKRIIYLYKNMFNIITKRKSEEFNIWILPFQEKITNNKLEKIITKQIKKKRILENTKFVVSNKLIQNNIIQILKKYDINYLNGNYAKKILVFKALDYINNLQNKELNKRDITILVDESNEINNYIINTIAIQCKTIKIVSKKIYKFRGLEENLYNDYGVAVQFSNSYKKSLVKSEIIINLDFNEIEINEYEINNSAIIINTENSIKIKSKLFSGIIANSYRIKFLKELRDKFSKYNLLHKYENLILYESVINWKNTNYSDIEEKIEKDNIKILNFIGNNGIINKKEFKIVN